MTGIAFTARNVSLAWLLDGIAAPQDARGAPTIASVQVADLTLDSREVRPGPCFARSRAAGATASNSRPKRPHAARARCCGRARGSHAAGAARRRVRGAGRGSLAFARGRIADRFFQWPSPHLPIAGVTGTNGKTTCAWLLAQDSSACRPPRGLHRHARLRASRARCERRRTPRPTPSTRAAAARGAARAGRARRWHGGLLARARPGARATACASARPRSPTSPAITSTTTARCRLRRGQGAAVRLARTCGTRHQHRRPLRPRARRAAPPAARRSTRAYGSAAAGAAGSRASLHARDVRRRPGRARRCDDRRSFGALALHRLVGDFNADNLLVVLAVLLACGVPLDDAAARSASAAPPPGAWRRRGGGGGKPLAVDRLRPHARCARPRR